MMQTKFKVREILKFGLAATLLFSSSNLFAQTADHIKEVTDKVADLVIQNTDYGFVNKKTGEQYKSTRGMPDTADVKSLSHYTTWYYPYGVLATGMVRAGQIFHEKKFIDYAARNYTFIFNNLAYFKKKYEKGEHKVEFRALFRMKYLDDCGAMGAGLADVYMAGEGKADKPKFRDYINRAGEHILQGGEATLSDGTFCRPRPRKMTIWGDDLYMGVSLLARMGKITGDHRYFDDGIKQVTNFNKYLYDQRTGLFFHCWYSDVNMNGTAHWGRANGWIMFAQVALLNNLPENYPGRQKLIHLLLRQIVGVSRYQDSSGLWHQLLDKPASFLETSCSAMFVYSIAKAVNEGWIPKTYLDVAKKGWQGLETKINAKGEVENVCIGTNIHDDIAYYYTRPHPTEDPHVLGPVLLAGAELYKAVTAEK
jgi:rhamnogalacturonyl hydrolase YesR